MGNVLNFSKPIIDLGSGKPAQEHFEAGSAETRDVEMDTLLANLLMNSNEGNYKKFGYWAIQLYGHQPLDLDKVDTTALRKFIDDSKSITNLVKYQLDQVFEESEILALTKKKDDRKVIEKGPKP